MADASLHVSSLEPADIPDVVRIAELCGLAYWTARDYLLEVARHDAVTLRLASSSARCVGFLVARIIPGNGPLPDAELYNIGIRPMHQRAGGGDLLMSALLDECKDRGVENIWLDVRPANTGAIALYTKWGFAETARRGFFYRDPVEDAVVMRLKLGV
jgi:ribosomal-protein-alanine N-acetyltransferase